MAVGNTAIAGCLLKCQGHFWFMASGLFFEINFIRGPIAQRLVESFRIVELEVSLQVAPRVGNRRVLVNVNLLVFDAAPETLNKNVVEGPAPTVHADSDVLVLQYFNECRAGKLNALIGVHDLRL